MIRCRLAISALGCVLITLLAAAQSTETTVAGYLTDTLCGARGATERHIECPKRVVASGKGQYAIYDEREKRLYILEPQATADPATRDGQRVKITGTVRETPLTRAGQSLAPSTSPGASPSSARVQQHKSPLGDASAIAGVLVISSIEPAPPPSPPTLPSRRTPAAPLTLC